MCFQIAVKNWKKERAPITKSKLAYEVAKRVKQYLDTLAVSHHASFVLSALTSENRRLRWTRLSILGGKSDRVA